MSAIIETTTNLSNIAGDLIDFLVRDERLSSEFEEYLKKNNVQVQRESELTDILLDYILDGRMSDNVRVLDYYLSKNEKSDEKTLRALKNSFISVFRIKKVLKNAYETYCLISEKDFTLIPLVKTTSLRGIANGDFIKARVIEIDNNYFLLEIMDVFGSLREWDANKEAVILILRAPNVAVLNNKDKFLQIKQSAESFNASFLECFKSNEAIISNKDADRLLSEFYFYHTGEIEKISEYAPYNEADYKYFEIEQYKNDVVQNAYTGFSGTDELFDAGVFADSERGIFVIPFLGTFNKILKEGSLDNTEGAKDCVINFLTSIKTPINLIKKKAQEFSNFIKIVNLAAEREFKTVDEIIEFFRPDYNEIKTQMNFSPIMVLYNSKAFSVVLNEKEEHKRDKTVGRNDLCPCGSGKKYKKCCLLKEG